MGEAALRLRHGALPGSVQEQATAGVAAGADQCDDGRTPVGNMTREQCAQNTARSSHIALPTGPHQSQNNPSHMPRHTSNHPTIPHIPINRCISRLAQTFPRIILAPILLLHVLRHSHQVSCVDRLGVECIRGQQNAFVRNSSSAAPIARQVTWPPLPGAACHPGHFLAK